MKKIIRHKKTGLFLSRAGKWIEQMAHAWQFSYIDDAEAAQAQLNLQDVEFYYAFREESPSPWDFAVEMSVPKKAPRLSKLF